MAADGLSSRISTLGRVFSSRCRSLANQGRNVMKRREFLKTAGVGLAASAVAAPAIAQSMPEIKWRLTSSFPKSLDTLWGAAETFSKYVGEATDNRFQVQTFAAGEIVPGLQALDAVSNATVEACHTAAYYYFGKDPTFSLFCAVPFGLNGRQQNAWFYDAGAGKLMDDFTKKFNVVSMLGGNTGAQMGGWFRKEVKEVADLNGLKMRIAGLAGQVFQKLGAVPQQIAGGDIYPALEKGTVDAAEWVGPYDDEKLGFVKVARYYYYPGWWEGCGQGHNIINLAKWNELPKHYQSAIISVSNDTWEWVLAKYDAGNPAALKRLLGSGALLRAFPPEVMDACYKAANEIYADLSKTNPMFKKLYDTLVPFRSDSYLWLQVAEGGFDNFMIRMRTRA